MNQKHRTHINGIISRLRLIWAALTSRTDGVMAEAVAYLDRLGHVYSGVCGNIDPLSFLSDILHTVLGSSTEPDVIRQLPDVADLIFTDSSHTYEATRQEIKIYSRKLSPSGVLVMHDSIKWPGVRRAIQDVASRFDLMTFATSKGNGITVIMRK